ncbi:hypothetical protein HMPREF1980_01193 [Actinomyces sp. oral taxon 172 str. F0311]|nr:hypothetical protein HMPREF1980_01193 [Actinomyces sp. oral taxon 172 str. F0311]
MLIFPHQQAEKSPRSQHVLSFNQKKKRDTFAVSRWRGWGA